MENKEYNLSNEQNNIWLIEKYYTNTNVNNIAGLINFKQSVDIELLKKSVNILVQKNEALRFRFINKNGELVQYVEKYIPFDIEVLEIQNTKEYIKEFAKTKFQIDKENLYHFEIIINKRNQEIKLISRFHHIITDAWSLSLIISEIIKIYSDLKNDVQISDDEFYPYTKFIENEESYINSERYYKDKAYWNEVYEAEPQILKFKNDKDKSDGYAERKQFKIDKKTSLNIKEFCDENSIRSYCFFLTCVQLLLNKKYNIDDAIIGNPFLNRKDKNEREAIGAFINTLPVRLKSSDEDIIIDLLRKNNRIALNCLRHEKYPYNEILDFVKNKYGINQNLYNVLFSYQNAKDNRKEADIEYSTEWIFNNIIADDLQIHIHDRDDNGVYYVVYDYKKNIFNASEIEEINKIYINILRQILNNKEIKVKEISILDENEKNIILNKFNNKKMNFEKELNLENIYNLILDLNASNLNKIAIKTENESITYKELFERVNKFANYLKTKYSVKENENIGIIAEKNINTIISILGVIKLNCTIIPIDPNYPAQRRKYMIENANVTTLLYTDNQLDDVEVDKKINVKYENYINEEQDTSRYNYNVNNNLYIIFTSGSTGNPKPVTISHKNMINLILNELKTNEFNLDNSKILQFATLSFDVSYQEIFTAFVSGSELVLIDDETKKDNNKLAKYIIDNQIDILFIPPRYLTYLAENKEAKDFAKNLRHIITAGEQLIITKSIEDLINKGIIIHNHYGPAETHVATIYIVDKNNIELKPPIGSAIYNSNVYILNKNLELCGIDIPGEIYISGDCVGNGYYNKKELTNERFIKDPYNEKYIMYKTGDLGKYDKNGNIYYLGRSDFQVKVNGYRIEIEEVEKKISQLQEVNSVCVVVEKDELERNKLVAYIKLNNEMDYNEFKEKISKVLPQYMIPSKFYLIDKMPLNVNGKVDKKQLEANKEIYKLFTAEHKVILPDNIIEEKILKCMEEVLNIKNISVLDDFFELGGDSLSAIALQVKLVEEDIILNTQEIYDNPTARKLYLYHNNKKVEEQKDEFKKIEFEQKKVEIKEKNNILLTGVTGFLGIHVLNELLKTDNTIYCIVRKSQTETPEERVLNRYKYYFGEDIKEIIDNKIFIIKGDLIKENLGIRSEKYNSLAEKIDIVINVAASVKHYGKRDYNFEHNVVSTKNIISFAKQSNAFFNHISTVGIAGNNLVDTNNCYKDSFSESDLIIGQKYNDNVYVSTKLQAEQEVIKAIQNNEIIGNIIRVGNLMNRYSDNKFQQNQDTNAFQNKIKEILKLNYLPNTLDNYSFDLTPVDLCAEAIIKLVFFNKYNNIYHVLNSKELNIEDISKILAKFNIKLDANKKITKSDIAHCKWLANDFILNNKRKIQIDSKKTQDLLSKLNFEWKNDEKYNIGVFKSIIGVAGQII